MGQQKMTEQGMKGGMMRKMAGGQIVATIDGGVIVLIGNKLMKYDKELNPAKEIEIKMERKENPRQ